jgi:type IV pilus assembly protein PilX
MKRHIKSSAQPLHSTRGVSMIIVLVFIVILTSLGTYALRRALLIENVSRNTLDLQVAKQAAQAALRDGERDVLLGDGILKTNAICARGSARPVPVQTGAGGFDQSLWNATCPAGQCIVGRGKRGEAYVGSNFSDNTTPVQPWWPSSDPNTPPPIWNNTISTKPNTGNAGACTTFTGGVPYGTYTGAQAVTGVIRQPEYLIEVVQTGFIEYFRITARGWGMNTDSEVMLQSIVKVQVK